MQLAVKFAHAAIMPGQGALCRSGALCILQPAASATDGYIVFRTCPVSVSARPRQHRQQPARQPQGPRAAREGIACDARKRAAGVQEDEKRIQAECKEEVAQVANPRLMKELQLGLAAAQQRFSDAARCAVPRAVLHCIAPGEHALLALGRVGCCCARGTSGGGAAAGAPARRPRLPRQVVDHHFDRVEVIATLGLQLSQNA